MGGSCKRTGIHLLLAWYILLLQPAGGKLAVAAGFQGSSILVGCWHMLEPSVTGAMPCTL